jgi:methylglyoxal synthase
MEKIKNIALIAHDNQKKILLEWVERNWELLLKHKLICTGTTGKFVEKVLLKKKKSSSSLEGRIIKLKSGPLGGDQQLGAMVSEGKIDLMIFLWDPMQPHPYDVDVKTLLRISVLYNIPTACNRSTADFLISSPLMEDEYQPAIEDYSSYLSRNFKQE